MRLTVLYTPNLAQFVLSVLFITMLFIRKHLKSVSINQSIPSRICSVTYQSDHSKLTKDLSDLSLKAAPSESDCLARDDFLSQISSIVQRVVDGGRLAPFGSAVNGFWTPVSDIDISIIAPGVKSRAGQLTVLKLVGGELLKYGSHWKEEVFGAKVPILKWRPLRSVKNSTLIAPGFSADLSVNNSLAVVNSHLIGEYSKIDDRYRQLGLAVKLWAKSRGINDRSRGSLSSFALLLMLTHFLQKKFILPDLQELAIGLNLRSVKVEGKDVRFLQDKEEALRELAEIRNIAVKRGKADPAYFTASAGVLLSEFFRFYGFEYKSKLIRITDVHDPAGTCLIEERPFQIENPFEPGIDIANVNQIEKILQEFRRAAALTAQGKSLEEVCGATKH